jgi:hypothetical protein
MSTATVGVFHDVSQAARAVEALKRAGFEDHQIAVAGRYEATETQSEPTPDNGEGTAQGVLCGAGLGCLVGPAVLARTSPVFADEVSWLDEQLPGGTAAVAVDAGGRDDEVRDILRRNGAEGVGP